MGGEYKMEKLHHWGTEGKDASKATHYILLVISGICGVAIGWTSMNAQQYVTATTMLLSLTSTRLWSLSTEWFSSQSRMVLSRLLVLPSRSSAVCGTRWLGETLGRKRQRRKLS